MSTTTETVEDTTTTEEDTTTEEVIPTIPENNVKIGLIIEGESDYDKYVNIARTYHSGIFTSDTLLETELLFYTENNFTSDGTTGEDFDIFKEFKENEIDHVIYIRDFKENNKTDYEKIASDNNFLLWVVDYNIEVGTCANDFFYTDGYDAFGRQCIFIII